MRARALGLLSCWIVAAGWGAAGARAQQTAGPSGADVVLASAEPAQSSQPPPAELERARAQFQRGVELAGRGDYTNAAKRFREALAIHHAPAVAYNLASALFELRQYEEAYNLVQSVLTASDTPQAVRARAEQLERTLQEQVARLTVIVGSTSAEIVISVDGEPLAPQQFGVARALPPGKHVVVAERGGARVSEREIEIPLRTAALVDVSLVATPGQAADTVLGASAAANTRSDADTRDGDDAKAKRRLRWWWIGGASALAVGAGVVLAVALARRDPGSEAPLAGDTAPGVLVWK